MLETNRPAVSLAQRVSSPAAGTRNSRGGRAGSFNQATAENRFLEGAVADLDARSRPAAAAAAAAAEPARAAHDGEEPVDGGCAAVAGGVAAAGDA